MSTSTALAAPQTLVSRASPYAVRLAAGPDDVRAAQALRFEVFNVELDEGLVDSYACGLDADPFDAICDHLIVEDLAAGTVAGTYRLQTGRRALDGLGYYSGREFDLSPFEPQRAEILELGRACIDARHRNFAVLNLLWKGIAAYAREHGTRCLIGCSSFTTQNPADGAAAYRRLAAHLAPPAWRTSPQAAFACALETATDPPPKVPRLLSAYLALGAAICGPPAIDREFRTVDFLTWADLAAPQLLTLQSRGRFIG
jgi:putative hemolysin